MVAHPEITTPPTRTVAHKRDTIVTVFSTIIPEVVVTPTAEPKKKPSAVGPIVGGLIGGVAAGALAAFLIWWCIRHRKREHQRAARAFQRRRQRQLQAAQKRNTLSASASINSASQNLNVSGAEKGLGFDPSVAVASPARVYTQEKEYDPFKTERGYGYEPQPLQYTSNGDDYFVQQSYDQRPMPLDFSPLPDRLSQDADDYIVGMAVSTDDQVDARPMAKSPPTSTKTRSPPSSPPQPDQGIPRSSKRGATRAAVADKAAAALSAPVTTRHRPARPSPLATADERMSIPEDPFASPRQGNSPPSTSPTSSSSSHAYAAAATGQWGMTSNEKKQAPVENDPRTPSGQYSYDPFAEYHQYVARDDDEVLQSPDQDQGRKSDWI